MASQTHPAPGGTGKAPLSKRGPSQRIARESGSVRKLAFLAALMGTLATGANAMAYEKRAYAVLESDRGFEIRAYSSAVVAETIVEGEFEDVGGEAFRILVAYISGANQASESIAMTAPVTQELDQTEIAMTARVSRDESRDRYRVTFMMPSAFTLETLPEPRDERIRLRQEDAQRFAAVRYSGFWSRTNYDQHLEELRGWLGERRLEATGGPVWARYDPPFMPWFLRTNEILIPVDE